MFNVVSGLSLLLCVATAVLWVRSYVVADAMTWDMQSHRIVLVSVRGSLHSLAKTTSAPHGRFTAPAGYDSVRPPPLEHEMVLGQPLWSVAGLRWADFPSREGRIRQLKIPFWMIILPTAVMPAMALCHWQRRRFRDRLGVFCRSCGYDLRATPQRCPECGRTQ